MDQCLEGQLNLSKAARKPALFQFLTSLYLSVLFVSAEELRDLSWSTAARLLIFSHVNPNSPRPIDDPYTERLTAFVLVWLLALVLFFAIRLLTLFPFARRPLNLSLGFLAVDGLPAVLLYTGYLNRKLAAIAIFLGAAYVVLQVVAKTILSIRLSAMLLVVYFSSLVSLEWYIWGKFPLAFYAGLPQLDWVLGTYRIMGNIYPCLGLVVAVMWGMYAGDSMRTNNESRR
jgi:hypothetical protein